MNRYGYAKSLNLEFSPEEHVGGSPNVGQQKGRLRRPSWPDPRSAEQDDDAHHSFRAEISHESSASDMSDSDSDSGVTETHLTPSGDHMTMDLAFSITGSDSTSTISPEEMQRNTSAETHLWKHDTKGSQSLEMKTENVIDPLDSPTAEYEDIPASAHSSLTESRNTHSRSESTDVILRSPASRHGERRLSRWTKLMNLRSQASNTRSLMQEKRVELGEARNDIQEADEELMKLLRKIPTSDSLKSPSQKILDECLQRCQAARNIYGPLEEDYTTLERKLTREDYEIARLESKLEKYLPGTVPVSRVIEPSPCDDKPGPCDDEELDSGSEASSESDDEESEAETTIPSHGEDPLYEEYLSRLGDADLCREAYNTLLEDQRRLLEAQEVRNHPGAQERLGKDLLPEDQEFLDNFTQESEKLLSELNQIEEDVEQLRKRCIEKGLLGDLEPLDVEEGEEEDLDEWFDRTPDVEQSQYHKFEYLQYQPEEDETEDKLLLNGPSISFTGNRIMDWMLHKLRSSSHEVELLFRLSADKVEPLPDIQNWQIGVLSLWYRDPSNLPPSAYESRPTFTVTIAYSGSGASTGKETANSVSRHGKKQLLPFRRNSSSVDGTMWSGRVYYTWETSPGDTKGN